VDLEECWVWFLDPFAAKSGFVAWAILPDKTNRSKSKGGYRIVVPTQMLALPLPNPFQLFPDDFANSRRSVKSRRADNWTQKRTYRSG
jgi:hypothetical protein